MAYIDKLHGSYWELSLFRDWVISYHPKLLFNMYEPFKSYENWVRGEELTIANFSTKQDRLLLWRCPIAFVREYLEKQCGMKTRWYHKIFWTKDR